MDVREASSVAAAVEQAWSRLGGLDMLVNNAGIGMRTVNPRFMTHPQGFWQVPGAGSNRRPSESQEYETLPQSVPGCFLVLFASI